MYKRQGLNRIKIERSLTTSALAVFVPFVTQEVFMGGDAMYYGLNALSNNMILLDRKQSRCPNGLEMCIRDRECTVCGEILETEEIEKIYNQATTDNKGEAIVGGYLVIVTDTDSKNPVANASVALHADHTLSVRLPSGRLLDYADQTTITVLLTKDKNAVANMFIAVTDREDNYCEDSTCLLYTSRCV